MHLSRILLAGLCLGVLTLTSLPLSAQSDQKPTFKVAFNNPGYQHKGFWKHVSDVMSAAADDLNIELHTWYGDRDAEKMRQNAQKIFESGIAFDYLILVNEHQQASGFLRKSESHKVKTLYLLNTITKAQESAIGRPGERFKYWIGSITPDNRTAGYEMATSLIEFAEQQNWPIPTPVIFISGDNKTPASLYRNQGLYDAIEETGKLKIVHKAHARWSKERAQVITHKFMELTAPKPPFVVWAANDNIAHGAIDGIEKATSFQAGKDFAVAGLNWSPWGIEAVTNNQMTMTHGGHFFGGAWALVTLYDDFHGVPIDALDQHIRFKMAPLTRDNIPEYVKKLGKQQWNHIDFRHFSKTANKSDAYDFSLQNILAATK